MLEHKGKTLHFEAELSQCKLETRRSEAAAVLEASLGLLEEPA
jgi:hypothetical protein